MEKQQNNHCNVSCLDLVLKLQSEKPHMQDIKYFLTWIKFIISTKANILHNKNKVLTVINSRGYLFLPGDFPLSFVTCLELLALTQMFWKVVCQHRSSLTESSWSQNHHLSASSCAPSRANNQSLNSMDISTSSGVSNCNLPVSFPSRKKENQKEMRSLINITSKVNQWNHRWQRKWILSPSRNACA